MKKTFYILTIKIAILLLIITNNTFVIFSDDTTTTRNQSESIALEYKNLAKQKNARLYITPDLLFEQTHVLFSESLEVVEKHVLLPDLTAALLELHKVTEEKLNKEEKEEIKKLYTHNLDYLKTAICLINKDAIIPKTGAVAEELALVLGAKDIKDSPVMGYKEDYTQYIPRGHYTKDPNLERYFRAITWLGRMGFYVEPNPAANLSKEMVSRLVGQATLLTSSFRDKEGLENKFLELDNILTLWVGVSDDVSLFEAKRLMAKAIGKEEKSFTLEQGILSEENIKKISETIVKEAKPAKISATFVQEGTNRPPFSIKLLGQRFLLDSYVFNQLSFDRIKDFNGKESPLTLSTTIQGRKVRGIPRAYDLMAVLGSKLAQKELDRLEDSNYSGYKEQMSSTTSEASSMLKTDSFYNLYLSALQSNLTSESLLANQETANLRSSLGGWIMLRHDLVAYGKQSYTTVPRTLNFPEETEVAKIHIAPAGVVFASLTKAVEKIAVFLQTTLKDRKINVTPNPERQAVSLLNALTMLSSQAGKELSQEQAMVFLENLDNWAIVKSEVLITDVHTDTITNEVLQLGVGYPKVLTVDIAADKKAQAVVFSCYEFRQPISNRLTDEGWKKLLSEDKKKIASSELLN